MTTPASVIRAALSNGNVAAFLRVLRQGESDQTADAYSLLNGGDHATIPTPKHPFTGQKSPPGKAFGAYQAIPHTFDRIQALYPADIPDTSPASQDFFAVALIADRGALEDAIAGRFDVAVAKLSDTWIALRTLKNAAQVYQNWGGKLSPPNASAPPAQPATQTPATRTETLTDVPASDLDQTVAEFKAAGATVVKTKQPDGLWAIVATFGGKP